MGISPCNQFFTSAIVLLYQGTGDWYTRALQAYKDLMAPFDRPPAVFLTDQDTKLATGIRTVFPRAKRIYCYWHLTKNIATHGKAGLTQEEYDNFIHRWTAKVVQAKTEGDMNTGAQGLEILHRAKPRFKGILDYVKDLQKDKEHFVHVWIHKHLHFGQENTSRLEGGHFDWKRYMMHSKGDPFDVIDRTRMFMKLRPR
jgi:hypothetical protein